MSLRRQSNPRRKEFRPPSLRPSRLEQRGFTLAEMMVAVALMGLLMIPLSNMLSPALDLRAKVETDTRLELLKQAAVGAYRTEMATVDAQPSAIMALQAGTMAPVAANASGACASAAATFAPLARYLQMSTTDAYKDGWGQGLCVLMTTRQTGTQSGVSYWYHNYAFVSPGRDGAIDTGTSLSATSLTLSGDDKGAFIDGRSLVAAQVEATLAQVKRASDAVAAYFNARYLSNSDRDTAINYFARTNRAGVSAGEFDGTGALPNTGGAPALMTSNGISDVLGLTVLDVTNPWGGILQLDNSSDDVRTPENTTASLRSPPFTARITTTLPGGASITRTAVGAY
ncbi:type II secretion system protein [Limnohabitans radicicola]|uniref:Prepilin-type N-terminal cleavage/methylation domain-containing protein n=1 Tax=Limnohabitans radicicola TaxID=2771427 RepID=A0A927FGL6_9BURK|nr:prepilin-type N-terminal cleavage/methylation domain-containing protein [Limnohabitans radicicola]MBD8051084.1 prepilin-type N-terminal cleavage/methylation domain-containing protein [Limnohabitans radicicola]